MDVVQDTEEEEIAYLKVDLHNITHVEQPSNERALVVSRETKQSGLINKAAAAFGFSSTRHHQSKQQHSQQSSTFFFTRPTFNNQLLVKNNNHSWSVFSVFSTSWHKTKLQGNLQNYLLLYEVQIMNPAKRSRWMNWWPNSGLSATLPDAANFSIIFDDSIIELFLVL